MKKLLTIAMLVFAFAAGYVAPKQEAKAAIQQESRVFAGNFILQDGEPSHTKVFQFSVIPAFGTNLLMVDVFDKQGNHLGTPIRFKMSSGGRVAADLPGVSDSNFVTQDGHITNG